MVRLCKARFTTAALVFFLSLVSDRWLMTLEGRVIARQQVDFKRDIEPILRVSCLKCHGSQKALGQLRLDLKAGALEGGISGRVIIPGNSQQSRLIGRLLGAGNEARMPLGGELTQAQIALIRVWIDEGALWPDDQQSAETARPQHWAYLKPVRPLIPIVAKQDWVSNPIDNFVLARLEKEKLLPSPEAERAKLLRRVYLDLIGLPPSPIAVTSFLSDVQPDAYARVVDSLLASEHYGERWARHWLDLARYADSNGYEKDNPRVMWKYRDWVIAAFNRDLPFDQFTIEQIAGDMLPGASREQRIATGFHRNTMLNQEGGIDPEEARFETIVDRVNTTSTVWLGSTLACAQCHNHKYDPFSQKDYYRFYAFFEGSNYKIEGGGSERYVREPELPLASPGEEKKRLEIEAEIKALTEALKTQTPALERAQEVWESNQMALERQWTAPRIIGLRSAGGTVLTPLKDRSVLASGPNPQLEEYLLTVSLAPGRLTGLRIEALVDSRLPKGGPGRDPYGNFLATGVEASIAPINRPRQTRRLGFRDVVVDDTAVRFDAKRFVELGPRNSAVDNPTGWYINATRDQVRHNRQAVFVLSEPVTFTTGTILRVRLKFEGGSLGQGIGRLRLSVSDSPEPPAIVELPARLRPVLHSPPSARQNRDKDDLAAQFRLITPLLKAERDRVRVLNAQMTNLGIISALVMQEREPFERPATFLRERGSFMSKGEQLQADIPQFLPRIPGGQAVNRLALARWLVSEENPLTARVAVNRIWEQIFGRGIVETSEDFGIQGAAPSHPELLDWLSTEFIQQKWSVKSLLKSIVMSSTYRQASSVTASLNQRDPDNRLLARGPRFRIEAEMVRDVALVASGLLSHKVGGPSVYPWQPEGVWRNPYSGARWVTSPGEDRYRRSVYTFLRRTSPYPSLTAFDATSRETCTVRRVRTNTPLQALTTLNDEAFFEFARALAGRMLVEGGAELKDRLDYGFRLCTSRAAKPDEIARLARLFAEQHERFRAKPELAGKVVRLGPATKAEREVAELAALTVVANVLLNLDETLSKE